MLLQCILLFVLPLISPGLGEIRTNNEQRTLMHFVQYPYSSENDTWRNPPTWYRPSIPNLNEIPKDLKIPSGSKYFPEYTIGTEVKPKYKPKPVRGKRSPVMEKH